MLENTVSFNEGEFIFREMAPADGAYIILKGEIGIYKCSTVNPGEIIPLGLVKAGEFLGELGIVSASVRSAEAIALCPVEALVIPYDQFERELNEASPWIKALVTGIAERLIRTDELLLSSRSIDPKLLGKILPAIMKSSHIHFPSERTPLIDTKKKAA